MTCVFPALEWKPVGAETLVHLGSERANLWFVANTMEDNLQIGVRRGRRRSSRITALRALMPPEGPGNIGRRGFRSCLCTFIAVRSPTNHPPLSTFISSPVTRGAAPPPQSSSQQNATPPPRHPQQSSLPPRRRSWRPATLPPFRRQWLSPRKGVSFLGSCTRGSSHQ